jgi:hypothetical protein
MNFLPAPIRKGIKALLKPILRPLVLRLDMPFRVMLPKIDAIERAIAQLDIADALMVQRLQALEHASEHDRSLTATLRNENQNLVRSWLRMRTDMTRLEQALHATRTELMPGSQGELSLEWVLIGRSKLATVLQAVRPLRLHLSRGRDAMERTLNISNHPRPGVDLIADFGDLPFQNGSVDEIFVSELIEQGELRGLRLRHWRELLRPGGKINLKVAKVGNDVAANAPTPKTLHSLLKEAGFVGPATTDGEPRMRESECFVVAASAPGLNAP